LEAEEEEKRLQEEEIRKREAAAQRELEEYLRMKATFVIEEEGCDVKDDAEEENLLGKFVDHVKVNHCRAARILKFLITNLTEANFFYSTGQESHPV